MPERIQAVRIHHKPWPLIRDLRGLEETEHIPVVSSRPYIPVTLTSINLSGRLCQTCTLHMELTALSRCATSLACCKKNCHAHTKTSPCWAGGLYHDAGGEVDGGC